MEKMLLLRFGDLMLKGSNRKIFLSKINNSIREKLNVIKCQIIKEHDRMYVIYDEADEAIVIKQLAYVPGLYSYSFVYKSEKDVSSISLKAIEIIKSQVKEPTTFKVEAKRADKNYYLTSQEVPIHVAPLILKEVGNLLKVDVKNPKLTLTVEIRPDAAYMFVSDIKGMGGFPMGTGGNGLLMMSGGIDSPVAAYLMMKQGVEVELLHFESTPLTPLESVQKVIDLAKVLSNYMPNNKIKLHIVPFVEIHQEILKHVNDSYIITILRRHMYRLGEMFARKNDMLCLINGESVGQVASQTLSSINVVESVTRIPIIRPLATYDKLDIIKIARNIETYEISIRPFNDCCSIYVPTHPVTHPKENYAINYENTFNYLPLIEKALKDVITIVIHKDAVLDIASYGFETREAFGNYFDKDNY